MIILRHIKPHGLRDLLERILCFLALVIFCGIIGITACIMDQDGASKPHIASP